MTHNIEVFSLRVIHEPKPNKGGAIVIANFDCIANGFELTGCALVRTRKNGLIVWMPAIEGKNKWGLAIAIKDSSLRHALMDAARSIYRAMGGTEAEWTPKDVRTENYNFAAARIAKRVELKTEEDQGLKTFLASAVSPQEEPTEQDAAE